MVHVAVLLDQTGSMMGRKLETISSFNSYVAGLIDQKMDCDFTLTLFNARRVEVRYLKASLSEVVPLTEDTYLPCDATPLLDAIAKSIEAVGDERQCLFIIFTDGEENASRSFTKSQVKQLIESREGRGWRFVFFGIGGMDSVAEASAIGIPMASTVTTSTLDTFGTSSRTASAITSTYVATGSIPETQAVYNTLKKEEDEEALKRDQQKAEADKWTRKLAGEKSA
jgi:hypothetical protein